MLVPHRGAAISREWELVLNKEGSGTATNAVVLEAPFAEYAKTSFWLTRSSAAPAGHGLKMPKEVRPFALLVPLNELQDEHYTVYFCKPEAEAQAARPPRFCVKSSSREIRLILGVGNSEVPTAPPKSDPAIRRRRRHHRRHHCRHVRRLPRSSAAITTLRGPPRLHRALEQHRHQRGDSGVRFARRAQTNNWHRSTAALLHFHFARARHTRPATAHRRIRQLRERS